MSIMFNPAGKTELLPYENHPAALTTLSQIFTERSFRPRADLIEDFTSRVIHLTSLVQERFHQLPFEEIFQLIGQELRQLVNDFPQADPKTVEMSGVFSQGLIPLLPAIQDNGFGRNRIAALNTPLTGDQLQHICCYNGIVWETDPPSTEDQFSIGALWENIDGISMELTRFHLLSINENDKNVIVSMKLRNEQGQNCVSLVFQKCEQLLSEILQTHDSEIAQIKIGALYWWILQASPWTNGNAEAAEILVAALSNYKSIQLGSWKTDTTLIALTHTLNDFIQLYPFLRE